MQVWDTFLNTGDFKRKELREVLKEFHAWLKSNEIPSIQDRVQELELSLARKNLELSAKEVQFNNALKEELTKQVALQTKLDVLRNKVNELEAKKTITNNNIDELKLDLLDQQKTKKNKKKVSDVDSTQS